MNMVYDQVTMINVLKAKLETKESQKKDDTKIKKITAIAVWAHVSTSVSIG